MRNALLGIGTLLSTGVIDPGYSTGSTLALAGDEAEGRRPNVVFIMADDK